MLHGIIPCVYSHLTFNSIVLTYLSHIKLYLYIYISVWFLNETTEQFVEKLYKFCVTATFRCHCHVSSAMIDSKSLARFIFFCGGGPSHAHSNTNVLETNLH